MPEVPAALSDAAGRVLGAPVQASALSTAPFSVRPVLRLFLADGRTAVLKTGAPTPAESAFRWCDLVAREVWLYEQVPLPSALRPAYRGVVRAAGWWGLLLEDLTSHAVPPPWTTAAITATARALAHLHAAPPPASLPPDWHGRDRPQPFFARIAARQRAPGDLPASWDGAWWDWFERQQPTLERAYQQLFGPERQALVHNNVRSDNLFLDTETAILIDWDHAILATPAYDSVYWALGVEREGGPPAAVVHAHYEALAGPLPEAEVLGVLAFWLGYFVDHLQAARSRPVNQQLRREYLQLVVRWLVAFLPPPPGVG